MDREADQGGKARWSCRRSAKFCHFAKILAGAPDPDQYPAPPAWPCRAFGDDRAPELAFSSPNSAASAWTPPFLPPRSRMTSVPRSRRDPVVYVRRSGHTAGGANERRGRRRPDPSETASCCQRIARPRQPQPAEGFATMRMKRRSFLGAAAAAASCRPRLPRRHWPRQIGASPQVRAPGQSHRARPGLDHCDRDEQPRLLRLRYALRARPEVRSRSRRWPRATRLLPTARRWRFKLRDGLVLP